MKASEPIPNNAVAGNGIETITGLSEIEAQKRLKTEGYNELPSQKKQNIFGKETVSLLTQSLFFLRISPLMNRFSPVNP
ncbi:MAG: cation-transporting P-type ATPase [Euryarchaeota archaeon]|nr:cation-transporting P-type ATPase [Euryarchaeota archaeon]